MKKITLILAFAGLMGVNANASFIPAKSSNPIPDAYSINDANIESMFAGSQNVTATAFQNQNATQLVAPTATSHEQVQSKSKSAIVAILLDFFLGGLGIHRAYLGTKTFTWIGYILTCGGIFGIVPFIDFILLIVNFKDISDYEDNTKFFMW